MENHDMHGSKVFVNKTKDEPKILVFSLIWLFATGFFTNPLVSTRFAFVDSYYGQEHKLCRFLQCARA
jgi:hypothetical protein